MAERALWRAVRGGVPTVETRLAAERLRDAAERSRTLTSAAATESASVVGLGDLEFELLVEALCHAEAGELLEERDVPYYVACWFLDHAARFRQGGAHAALKLMQQLARWGDDELCARVLGALVDYVDLDPPRVEKILLSLCSRPSRAVQAALVNTLIALLASSGDARFVTARFAAHSPSARVAIEAAARLRALRR